MDGVEVERLALQFRRGDGAVAPLKFPGENVGEFIIVTQRFAFRRLMFFAEMRAARFIARECINAHELGELEKIGNPPRTLERLIEILAIARNADLAPEFLAQLWNFSKCFLQ